MRSSSSAISSSGFLPVTVNTRSAIRLITFARGIVRLVDAVAESHQPACASPDFTFLMNSGTRVTDPISVSIRSTASLAPPWSGP